MFLFDFAGDREDPNRNVDETRRRSTLDRRAGRERAERIVADRTRFVLDDASWTAFNDALDRPAEVKPELRELFARSRPE